MNAKISEWIAEDKYLNQIAHYFRFAPQLNNTVLKEVLEAGIRLKNDTVVAQVLASVFQRYKDGTPTLIECAVLPGIAYFTEKHDARWVNLAWFISKDASPLANLTATQVDAVLDGLVYFPQIDTHAERILGILTEIHAERVFDFFGSRLRFSTARKNGDRYEAIPHHFYELKHKFSNLADHAIDTVRQWFVSGDSLFQFTGGRLISSSFPDFPDALKRKLSSYINRNVRGEIEFVIDILSSYRGQFFLYDTCKEIVRGLPEGDPLLDRVQLILDSTDIVSGEFGLVEAYRQKREAVLPWLSDGARAVRSFTEQYIRLLDRQISAEQRRSEEDVEMRKRMYDNPKGDEGQD